MHDTEAGTKRSGDQACAGGGANQREMVEVEGMDARTGALADDQVDAKIFHGGIENFFDRGLQAVNFVEEEDVAGFERSEDGGQVAFALKQRAGASFDRDVKFIGDDLRQRGLAQAGGTVKKDMVESFFAVAGGFEGDRD